MSELPGARRPDYRTRAAELVGAMTDEEKLWCLDGDAPFWAGLTYLGHGGYHKSPFRAAHIDRIGFPGIAFADGPRGVVVGQATCFPVSMARGATWDPDLEERIGEVIGTELRAVGADLYGGVCVNLLRHPAWGRAQETYGEDPYHVGEMGAALTRGIQRHVMACVKHFACNSMENARFSVDVAVSEADLHEVYLPHFKRIVDEGVAAVMSAYNSVNGEWCGQNRTLLTDVLRHEWSFEGFVISDWIFGIRDAALSVEAGLDVEMPYRMVRARDLADSLADGAVEWSAIDACVEHLVATRLRFEEIVGRPAPGRDVLACPAHRELAREAAAKAVVVLRNEVVGGEPVLPLDRDRPGTVALFGRLATQVNLGDGGSSDVWAPTAVTVAEGLGARLPDGTLVIDDSGEPAPSAAIAAGTGTAVVVVGYTRRDEGEFIGEARPELAALFPGDDDPGLVDRYRTEIAPDAAIEPPAHVRERADPEGFSVGGDRSSLALHDDEVALVRAVAAVNPRTVVVVVAGSAVVTSAWDGDVPALVQGWYAGMEGGHALADVLTGSVEPGGRLPFSVPRSEANLPPFDRDATSFAYDGWHGYWHLARTGAGAAYPFGFGLGYTSFETVGARVTMPPEPSGPDSANSANSGAGFPAVGVSATVRNCGDRPGIDVLQVYGTRSDARRPARLCGFERAEIEPGATETVEITVSLEALAERDTTAHTMVVRPGRYDLRVARHAEDEGIALTVEAPPHPHGDPQSRSGGAVRKVHDGSERDGRAQTPHERTNPL